MNKPRFFITDVFTDRKYGGNPLATFIDCDSLSDQEMQSIAKEINFSETTFITSQQSVNGGYVVRIFTPTAEVEFAGHPTLGTAHVIRNHLLSAEVSSVNLHLRIGTIPVRFSQSAEGAPVLWMKQPPPRFGQTLDANTLSRVLGIGIDDLDLSCPIEEVSTGFPHIIVPLKNLDALRRVKINKDRYFALVAQTWPKLILVFSRQTYEPGQALSVRVFADFYGIEEDAATGSGNGCLAAYLVRHKTMGESIDITAGQGYEIGRPSRLALRAKESVEGIVVQVGGSVVDVAQGIWG